MIGTTTVDSRATSNTEITIPSHVLFRDLGGEAVVLNLQSGRYFGLDEVGTRFWRLIEEHGAFEPALNAMHGEFEAPLETLRADLKAFLAHLAENQLIDLR